MILISSSLMAVWMFSFVLGITLGGLIHVVALAAVMIIVLSGNRTRQTVRAVNPRSLYVLRTRRR